MQSGGHSRLFSLGQVLSWIVGLSVRAMSFTVTFSYARPSAACASLEALGHRTAVIRSVCSARLPAIEPG